MLKTDETILADLKHMARTSEPIDLLNVYKGIPVLLKGKVEKVGADRAIARFEKHYESICLSLENKTTLLSDILAGPVNATALAVDLEAGTATLTQFHYAMSKIGDRMSLRVMPHDVVTVTITSGKQPITATLMDLSMSGVGLHITPVESAAELRRKAVVQLTLKLNDQALDLSGTIHYLKYDANACRLGITLVQTRAASVLMRYIHKRQEEILTELKALYQAAVK